MYADKVNFLSHPLESENKALKLWKKKIYSYRFFFNNYIYVHISKYVEKSDGVAKLQL